MAAREGRNAVDLFQAIAGGEIKALWVMGTNPAASLPRASAACEALARLELLVVSDNVLSNDTTADGAHILLPAAAWGEKGGVGRNGGKRCAERDLSYASTGDNCCPELAHVTLIGRYCEDRLNRGPERPIRSRAFGGFCPRLL